VPAGTLAGGRWLVVVQADKATTETTAAAATALTVRMPMRRTADRPGSAGICQWGTGPV